MSLRRVRSDGTDLPDPTRPGLMEPERLSELRELIGDAKASTLPESQSPVGVYQLDGVTPELGNLLTSAPDLANELLRERDYLINLLKEVRKGHDGKDREVVARALASAGV